MCELPPKIIDVLPDSLTGDGILAAISELEGVDVPWDTYSAEMDIGYIERSGDKLVSPIVEKLMTDGELTSGAIEKLAKVIWLKYGLSWSKLWATQDLEYDPISNYDMNETSSEASTEGKSESESRTDGEKRTASRSQADSQSGAVTNDTGVYGFNSSNSSPYGDSSGTTASAGASNEVSGEDRSGQESSIRSGDVSGSRQHVLRRSGNIGVTTSQQMIQSERDLWLWTVWDTIYHDIDRVLTLRVYS